MHTKTLVIALSMIALLAISTQSFAQNGSGSASSPGLAAEVDELQLELDELQSWQLTAENILGGLNASLGDHELEIQTTANRLSFSETLNSNTQKKLDDTINATVDKFRALELDDDGQDTAIGALMGRLDTLETLVAAEGSSERPADVVVNTVAVALGTEGPGNRSTIDIESYSFGATNSGSAATGSGAGAGRVTMTSFHVVKQVDRASPSLFLMCATGEHIPQLTFASRRSNASHDYLIITLEDVIVSSYQTGGTTSDGIATESVSFDFGEITVQFVPTNPDGSAGTPVSAGWDVLANQEV